MVGLGNLGLVGRAGSLYSRTHRRLVNREGPKKSEVCGRHDVIFFSFHR